MEGGKTVVKELPPSVSTEKFVEDIAKKLDVDCVKRGDTENVDLLVHTDQSLPLLERSYLTSNMHAFDSEGYLKKYDSAQDILQEYMRVGQSAYERSLDKRREDLAQVAREQKRRRDYIDVFCSPTETIAFPLQMDQLSRLMASKGWPGPIDDLVDSVRDREKTTSGSRRASEKAMQAIRDLEVWNSMTWRQMWLNDVDAFVGKL